jgi:hypothetical protein
VAIGTQRKCARGRFEPLLTRSAALLATGALVIAGCGGTSSTTTTYPINIQTNFLNSCEGSSTVAKCGCTLTYIETHVSLTTFEAADQAIRAGNTKYPSWLTAGVAACAKK